MNRGRVIPGYSREVGAEFLIPEGSLFGIGAGGIAPHGRPLAVLRIRLGRAAKCEPMASTEGLPAGYEISRPCQQSFDIHGRDGCRRKRANGNGTKEDRMTDLRLVTYCGLYCGLCAQRNRIPRRAESLREAMRIEGYEHWGAELQGFNEFWTFLGALAESEAKCSCREGGCGPPFCGIRKCAQEKGVQVCALCDEYPCHRIDGIAKGYPLLLADGTRMKEIGLEAWIEEQEERSKTGFAYADIRCYPYEVPSE